MLVFIGTVPDPKSPSQQGIYTTTLDADGKLTEPVLAAKTGRPSFVWIHPNGKFLFACNEVGNFDGKKAGGVSSFSIDDPKTGKLTPINNQPSGGQGPCWVKLDNTGRNILVANYGSGGVAVVPVDDKTGRLSPPTATVQHEGSSIDPKRQKGPHAHSFNPSPDNRFALACDLGLDKVLVYKLDATGGTLAPNDPPFAMTPGGMGPRHLVFSQDGKFAYVSDEMGNCVTVFAWDGEKGVLTPIETVSTLPAGETHESSVAEVAFHPNGKFLYVSNRFTDTIALLAVDTTSGKVTLVDNMPTRGKTPRHFRIDPTGKFMIVANQDSGDLQSFKIDAETGKLTFTGSAVKVSQPTCVMYYEGAKQ